MSVVLQDVRYACRSLLRAPGFTLVALITLALGIGGTTAIYSVVDGILLRPLPYPDADAIVRLSEVNANRELDESFAPADYLDFKRLGRSFASMAGYRQDIVDLAGRGDPIRLVAFETTAGFFDVFGLPPLAGRVYTESVDKPEGDRVAVISERFWDQQLGRAPDLVGSVIRLNGVPTTVLGIMPRTFAHPASVDLWMLAPQVVPTVPINVEGDLLTHRDVEYFMVMARLRPSVTLAQAQSDLLDISQRLAKEYPDTNGNDSVTAVPLQEALVGDVRTALLVLLGAVGFVLLIACANVASLLLARGTGRRRELAVRSALGASRGRITVQLLVESLLLATLGGLLGLVVANWGVTILLAIAPESIPRIAEVGLDPRVAAFGIAASVVVGVLFGLLPALQGARTEVVEALKDGGRTGTSRTGARSTLVVGEVALSLMLLIGAGLMLASFARLRAVDPGFAGNSLVLVGVPLPQSRYDNAAQARFYQQLHERLAANTVSSQSALVFPTPFGGANAAGSYEVEGRPPRGRTDRRIAQISSVSPGYFRTMGIPLLGGDDVSFADTRDRPGRIVINRSMAELEWPGEDALGKRIIMGGSAEDPNSMLTVVGVVADSRRDSLQTSVQPALYLSLSQFTVPFMSVAVRTTAGEAAAADAVRAAVRSLDPELPIDDVETIERVLERVTGQPRFRAVLVGSFALASLLLAAIGLYGLISYTVGQRIPEIGVRLALGASPAQIGRLIVSQGLRLAIAGVGLGLAGALAVTRLIEGLLFSVSATDPVVYGSLALLLLAIAAFACYVPARRAMRIDPMTALRAE